MMQETTVAYEHSSLVDTNIVIYTQWYGYAIGYPQLLQTPIGITQFDSIQRNVADRQDALRRYLKNPPDTDEYSWGRTIFAEPVFWHLAREAFAPLLTKENLTLEFAPTSIDESRTEEEYYQKGADFYVARNRPTPEGMVHEPICGIDITVANGSVIRNKRRKVGLQFATAMPVIVMPLKDLCSGERQQYTFPYYLDRQVRDAVIHGNFDTAFYGLEEHEAITWQKALAEKLQNGLHQCQQRITDCADPRITSFSEMPTVMEKLAYMQGVINEFYPLLAA